MVGCVEWKIIKIIIKSNFEINRSSLKFGVRKQSKKKKTYNIHIQINKDNFEKDKNLKKNKCLVNLSFVQKLNQIFNEQVYNNNKLIYYRVHFIYIFSG